MAKPAECSVLLGVQVPSALGFFKLVYYLEIYTEEH